MGTVTAPRGVTTGWWWCAGSWAGLLTQLASKAAETIAASARAPGKPEPIKTPNLLPPNP